MDAHVEKISDFLGKEDRVFSIPIYQRYYSWEESQCKKLFKDIQNIIDNISKKDAGHFLGTIVFIDKDADSCSEEYQIIDGQQRLMTLILLLKAMHDILNEQDAEEEKLKKFIYRNYLSTESYGSCRKMKLKPILSDSKMYDAILSPIISIKLSAKYESRVVENYKLFYKWLGNIKNNYSVKDVFGAFKKLYIISIHLDEEKECENPQLIFESLNSTGMDLTQGDLIRNFILMKSKPSKQEELYSSYWVPIEQLCGNNENLDDFLSLFTEMKVKHHVKKDNYYDFFKNKYFTEDMFVDSVAEELKFGAECYSYILGDRNYPNTEINDLLQEFRAIDSETLKPILLYLLMEFEYNSQFDDFEFAKCLKLLISYVLRRSICGKGTSSVRNTMYQVLNRIEANTASNRYEDYYRALLYTLCSSNFENGFILDTELKEAFLSFNFKNTSITSYILKKINNYQANTLHNWDNFTIEHIMPQELTYDWIEVLGRNYEDIHENYLNNIGNLTLVDNNSQLSNKTFQDKKTYYQTSIFKLTSDLYTVDMWNKRSILQRAFNLYNIAKDLWPVPAEYTQILTEKNELDCSKEYTFIKPIDVTGYKPHWIRLGNESEENVKHWKDVYEKFLDYVYVTYEQDFMRLVESNRLTFVSNYNNGGKFNQLSNGLYVPNSINANNIVKECSRIVNALQIIDDIGFYLKRREEKEI